MSVTEVKVPKLGLTIESVEIGTWLVRPGDHVREGDALVEVNADKADVVVESPATGTVAELLAEEGDEVSLTTVIARITDGAADPSGTGDPPEPPSPALAVSVEHVGPPRATPLTTAAADRVRSSPYARRLANDSDINIATLTGSGPGGRVVARDVHREQPRSPSPSRAVAHSTSAAAPVVGITTSSTWELTLPVPDRDRTVLYLACGSAASETLGLDWSGQIRLVVHETDASHHSVLSDWRDLTPEGLRRRLGGAPEDQTLPADLIVHDLDAVHLHTWTPAIASARTIVLGATKESVTLSGGAQPSLHQVHLVPVTLILPGQVEAEPIAAFRAALTTHVLRR